MKSATLKGAIAGSVAGGLVGDSSGVFAGGVVGSVEALVVVGLVKHFGAPAWEIVMATLKAVLGSVAVAFVIWLVLMGMLQEMSRR